MTATATGSPDAAKPISMIRFSGDDAFEDLLKAVDGWFACQGDGANKDQALKLSCEDETYYLEVVLA